ncbi:hypothetical protein [Pelotalea chapellei]|uniref:Uncharacterized protein n=1 Tax=Pelotalea chapellei TaxID=44671 RepID=A0ABS5U7P5_9BACT|nr:hypothetical protein [Pelotalea chapellei]MBT1071685.1 hypothetical protein [Pelotalea chapellei]
MEEKIEKTEQVKPAQRLCNEIQLFDLCDLDQCNQKDGRFCIDSELLARFESISEKEEGSAKHYLKDEIDEDQESDVEGDFMETHGFSIDSEDGWEED